MIPTISLARFEAGELSPQEAQQLLEACEDHGFFLLNDHGCEDVITRTFAASEQFFALPREQKLTVYRDELNPLGYYDRELTKQKRDLKEVYDFKAGGYISKQPARQTRWPASPPEFRATLTRFFEAFTDLSERTMVMIFGALGMPLAQAQTLLQNSFGEHHSSAARLNFYPAADPVPTAERDTTTALGDMALHHHTDPGAITLLLQDNHGGLQAESQKHGWIDVAPQPGTIVVNIGDVLQVWTNDRCTAGCHRVLPVQQASGRYSIPFFYQPRYDAQVEPWVSNNSDVARYESFSWREYIRGRVADNYTDLGQDDIQIAQYRIA